MLEPAARRPDLSRYSPQEMVWVYRGMCSFHVLRLITEHYGIVFDQAQVALDSLPDGSWACFDTPDGWRALAAILESSCEALGNADPLPITIN